MPEIVVASFNVHAGIDGWGRPYDALGACAALDADVLVLQENWVPDGEAGLASGIAEELGYACHTSTLARGRRFPPVAGEVKGFGPPVWSRRPIGLRLSTGRPGTGRRNAEGPRPLESGDWGLAVLSRLPFNGEETVDLGQLRRDPARRRALVTSIDAGGLSLTVVAVHMSHFTHGAARQFRRLERSLRAAPTDAVLLGDMNLWGAPLRVLLPGWRRAVRGRTWPAARPVVQIDHVLVRPGIRTVEAAVLQLGSSDHRAVRARLCFGE